MGEKVTSDDLRWETGFGRVHNVISQTAIANVQGTDDVRILEFPYKSMVWEVCNGIRVWFLLKLIDKISFAFIKLYLSLSPFMRQIRQMTEDSAATATIVPFEMLVIWLTSQLHELWSVPGVRERKLENNNCLEPLNSVLLIQLFLNDNYSISCKGWQWETCIGKHDSSSQVNCARKLLIKLKYPYQIAWSQVEILHININNG